MLLSQLITTIDGVTLHRGDADITGLAVDSRHVQPGFLFIAISGTKNDGTTFITDAINRGAVAVLVNEVVSVPGNIALLTSHNMRLAVSHLAAKFYARQPDTIVAVTGTSGKTSTAHFVRELWQRMGHVSASIGTLGYISATESSYGSLTTPDAISLHQMLDNAASKGVTHLAMEASSHGLDLHRLDSVRLKAGGFTNLSRDHLDYHITMENYFAAKQRLFTSLLPRGATAVLNADIPEFENLCGIAETRGLKVISYGKKSSDIILLSANPQANGQVLTLSVFGKKQEILLPVIGTFQAWNSLCALGLVIGSGGNAGDATASLSSLTGVPGRLQYIGETKSGGTVYVDYAHKPDALEQVLVALRPHVAAHKSKLGVVFGCGGNRDAGKRPIMGEIAARLADWVIVTDDNPRHENAATIRAAVMAGASGAKHVREVADRDVAIENAIHALGPHDVVVIAGKGHESGQIIGYETHPFDDALVAKKVLGI